MVMSNGPRRVSPTFPAPPHQTAFNTLPVWEAPGALSRWPLICSDSSGPPQSREVGQVPLPRGLIWPGEGRGGWFLNGQPGRKHQLKC